SRQVIQNVIATFRRVDEHNLHAVVCFVFRWLSIELAARNAAAVAHAVERDNLFPAYREIPGQWVFSVTDTGRRKRQRQIVVVNVRGQHAPRHSRRLRPVAVEYLEMVFRDDGVRVTGESCRLDDVVEGFVVLERLPELSTRDPEREALQVRIARTKAAPERAAIECVVPTFV